MTLTRSQSIRQEHIAASLDYQEYRNLIDRLLLEKRTTGDFQNNSEEILHYTQMNVQRMNRWDKTFVLQEELKEALGAISTPMIWLVLTEAWCGDAAQNIPALVKFAEQNPNLEIRFLLRDEHLEIMDAYLTNGGRSIPKLIALEKESLKEIGQWGPRPAEVQEMMYEFKKDPEGDYKVFAEKIHKWYAKDRGKSLQKEFLELAKDWQ